VAHAGLDVDAMYALRRDLTGTPQNRPARDRLPAPHHHTTAALHAALLRLGATYEPHRYSFGGRTLRLVCGLGLPLSAVKASFRHEPPSPVGVDQIVCATAIADPSPAHIVRGATPPGIVRPGTSDPWVTHDALLEELTDAFRGTPV
jgi:hypothetical protein